MGAFDAWHGWFTIARLFLAPGNVIEGVYDPTLPQFPIQSATKPTRWGFKEFFNGYLVGPEGTSLELLQAAVDAGKLADIGPGGSLGIKPGTKLTALDFEDSRYLMAPNGQQTSVYGAYVSAQVQVPTPPLVDPPAPPLPVVAPPAPTPIPAPGLSTPEVRVDELWAWVNQQWPTVRPIAIQMLKMFRKAVGHG